GGRLGCSRALGIITGHVRVHDQEFGKVKQVELGVVTSAPAHYSVEDGNDVVFTIGDISLQVVAVGHRHTRRAGQPPALVPRPPLEVGHEDRVGDGGLAVGVVGALEVLCRPYGLAHVALGGTPLVPLGVGHNGWVEAAGQPGVGDVGGAAIAVEVYPAPVTRTLRDVALDERVGITDGKVLEMLG